MVRLARQREQQHGIFPSRAESSPILVDGGAVLLHTLYPPEIGQSHISGAMHLHDLGMLSVYCCGWDLQDLLLRGFGGVPGKIDSAPAKHFRTALGQIVNFFYTLQGEAAGAVALSNFDTLLELRYAAGALHSL